MCRKSDDTSLRHPNKTPRTIWLAALFCALFAMAVPRPAIADAAVVQKDRVNIRQGAGTNTAILGRADKGAVFTVTGATGQWARIVYGEGSESYISGDMIQCFRDISVTGSSVRIRKSPSLQAAVLGGAQKGDKLTVLSYQDGWYQIKYDTGSGWISADYAKPGAAVALASLSVQNTAATNPSASLPATDNTANPSAQLPQTGDPYHIFDSAVVTHQARDGVLSGKIITLDPGHGSFADNGLLDPGAQSPTLGIWEKDINLDVALKLKAVLENMGATVWVSHMGSTKLSLSGRAALANQNASHMFISIHTNASEKPALSGHSVYYYAPPGDVRLGSQRLQRQALAEYVQHSMVRSVGRADLGVKESNFVVLRETNCPSILVETAYLTNGEEESLLARGAFRQRLADAIAQGVIQYFAAAK